jgi:hypothetical protein
MVHSSARHDLLHRQRIPGSPIRRQDVDLKRTAIGKKNLMLIPLLALGVAALAHRYLQTHAPSNAIVRRARRERPRLRIAGGLLGLSASLALVAAILADWVANGGPGWLNLPVLIAVWDAFKFGTLGGAMALRRGLAVPREASSISKFTAAAQPPKGAGRPADVQARSAGRFAGMRPDDWSRPAAS